MKPFIELIQGMWIHALLLYTGRHDGTGLGIKLGTRGVFLLGACMAGVTLSCAGIAHWANQVKTPWVYLFLGAVMDWIVLLAVQMKKDEFAWAFFLLGAVASVTQGLIYAFTGINTGVVSLAGLLAFIVFVFRFKK